MRMRTIAPLILGIIVAANFALGQSFAEVAEKEKRGGRTTVKKQRSWSRTGESGWSRSN